MKPNPQDLLTWLETNAFLMSTIAVLIAVISTGTSIWKTKKLRRMRDYRLSSLWNLYFSVREKYNLGLKKEEYNQTWELLVLKDVIRDIISELADLTKLDHVEFTRLAISGRLTSFWEIKEIALHVKKKPTYRLAWANYFYYSYARNKNVLKTIFPFLRRPKDYDDKVFEIANIQEILVDQKAGEERLEDLIRNAQKINDLTNSNPIEQNQTDKEDYNLNNT